MSDHYNKNNNRIGAALEHGKAHQEDHKRWSRRTFLRNLGLAGGASMLFSQTSLASIAASPLGFALSGGNPERALVLIRLKGGNDGLNTIVPLYDFSTYANSRPNLHIPENELLSLSNEFGMSNTMQALQPMWEDGQMKVINSVGYPDQNLSHFRSIDIWGSASDANVVDSSGWLGRFITNEYPDYLTNPPAIPPAIQIGSSGGIVFNDDMQNNLAVSVRNPDELYEIAQTGQLHTLDNIPECTYGEQLEFMRITANATFIYAEAIKEAYDNSTTNADYSTNLGRQLGLVARLIKGNLGTKLYMVTLDGFDTHAGQGNQHPQLLQQLSEAVSRFYDDLGASGRSQDVLAMTFSEFGRRIGQNASNGTDHGSAAPLLMFGEALNGNGFVGTNPDLQNTDANGNLLFHTDFREIYATVLENWLCIDAATVDGILGQSFNRIDVGLSCETVGVGATAYAAAIQHEARYHRNGQVYIHYTLPDSAKVKVEIFDITGKAVAMLFNGQQFSGSHQLLFQVPQQYGFVSGIYVYRIEVNGRAYSQKMSLVRS